MRNLVVQIEKWISIWQLVPVLYRVFRSPGMYQKENNRLPISGTIYFSQPMESFITGQDRG